MPRIEPKQRKEPIVIKKYANRRLYNTDTSTYVTLEDLAQMVRGERDFVVYDAKSGEDLTHSVLTQIIVEQEGRGTSMLPVPFLRQLIRFYGDSMSAFVPSYLQMSMENLTQRAGALPHAVRAHVLGQGLSANPFRHGGIRGAAGADPAEHGDVRAGAGDVHAISRRGNWCRGKRPAKWHAGAC